MAGKRSKTGQGKPRFSAILVAMLIRELIEGPCTVKDLEQVTGLSNRTVLAYVTALYRKRCLYIAGWERDAHGRQSVRVFAFGEKWDAKKEPPLRSQAALKAREERQMFNTLRLAA